MAPSQDGTPCGRDCKSGAGAGAGHTCEHRARTHSGSWRTRGPAHNWTPRDVVFVLRVFRSVCREGAESKALIDELISRPPAKFLKGQLGIPFVLRSELSRFKARWLSFRPDEGSMPFEMLNEVRF